MSKLIEIYRSLKKQDSQTLYLFKSGIFYIFIDEDAKIMNKELNLKLTNLNNDIFKCGFPSNSLGKYFNILNSSSHKFKIIDTSNSLAFTLNDFSVNESIKTLINKLKAVNLDNLSVSEAYNFIENLKLDVDKLNLD